jgi:hypothetical protein
MDIDFGKYFAEVDFEFVDLLFHMRFDSFFWLVYLINYFFSKE